MLKDENRRLNIGYLTNAKTLEEKCVCVDFKMGYKFAWARLT